MLEFKNISQLYNPSMHDAYSLKGLLDVATKINDTLLYVCNNIEQCAFGGFIIYLCHCQKTC